MVTIEAGRPKVDDAKKGNRSQPGDEVAADRRASRWGLREAMQRTQLLGKRRFSGCGVRRIDASASVPLKVNRHTGRAHFSNVQTCGSSWFCPVCSAKVRQHRADETAKALAAARSLGFVVYLLTLTVPHDQGDDLDGLLGLVVNGWRRLRQGRRGIATWLRYGIVATVRSLEVTHGVAGWHPHLHVLLIIDPAAVAKGHRARGGTGPALAEGGRLTAVGVEGLRRRLLCPWQGWAVSQGYREPSGVHGLDLVEVDDDQAAAEYLAGPDKGGEALSGVGAAMEVCRWDLKTGRRKGRAPMQLAADACFQGDVQAGVLFRCFAEAFSGRQAITFSKGFRALLLVEDGPGLTDEEVAESEVGGVAVVLLDGPTWSLLCWTAEARASLLRVAELEGADGVAMALDGLWEWAWATEPRRAARAVRGG